MARSILKEYVMGTNHFNKPAAFLGKKAVGLLICRLLLLDPGTDPMRPEMGVGIVSKYRYMFPDGINDLQKDIAYQLNTYLFPYHMCPVHLAARGHSLIVDITVDDTVYKYEIQEQEDNRVTLVELIEDDYGA